MTSIDTFLAVHANAIKLRSARAEVLAGNLANTDTPGYRPQDFDFAAALKRANAGSHVRTKATHHAHLPIGSMRTEPRTFFRDSPQQSLDENTVNSEYERVQFAENDVRYQASVQFITSRISGLLRAIRGE